MRNILLATSIALVAATAGCASLQVGAYYESGATTKGLTTFAFDTRDALPTGDPRLDNNPFFDERMRSAMALELESKGMRIAQASPDLLVHYHASVSQRLDVVQTDRDRGYTEVTGTQPAVVQFDEGTILVDVADARTKKVIWRGWARSDFGSVLSDVHAMDEFVRKAVHQMFEKFIGAGD